MNFEQFTQLLTNNNNLLQSIYQASLQHALY